MELVFLGTSCMIPTKERNHQSLLLLHGEDGLLIDCGEGTQRQLKIADIRPTKISKIFLTHWHGDHVLGLPGLLQTLNASEYQRALSIYGPTGTTDHFSKMFEAFSFRINFEHSLKEIKKDSTIEMKELIVEARYIEHSMPCLGFSFTEKDRRKIRVHSVKKLGIPDGPLLGKLQNNENIKWKGKIIKPEDTTFLVKGKKISVIFDTLPCKAAYELAKDADLLVCEAVYSKNLLSKAEENMHMTAEQAAQLAAESKSKSLVLTHFSQRYKTTEELVEEAKAVFPNTTASYDLMKIKV